MEGNGHRRADGNAHRRADAPTEAQLQDEFAHDWLLGEQGAHPRLSLSRAHIVGLAKRYPRHAAIVLVKPKQDARWVMFYSFGEGGEGRQYYDSHSIHDLRHPQSQLAYEVNGEPLPVLHRASLRLRVENQLGFKQVKWIKEVEFVGHFSERFAGQGGYNEDHEFYGYRGEI